MKLTSLLQRSSNYFARRKFKAYLTIEGFLAPTEAMALYRYASKVPAGGNILEIGCWKGKSTCCLASGLRRGTVNVIDPFDAYGEPGSGEVYEIKRGEKALVDQFKDTMSQLGMLEKINVLEGYSRDFVGKIPMLDLLFIDGDHSIAGCRFDYENYAPQLKSGGYLALHDYYPERADLGPTYVIHDIINKTAAYRPMGVYGSLWVAQKL